MEATASDQHDGNTKNKPEKKRFKKEENIYQ